MNFSANSLFHYTGSLDTLCSILEHGLQTSYSREFLLGNGQGKGYAVPVISFCDIPLSRVSDHVIKYGAFALAVSKGFATANEFSKVFYIDQFSSITRGIFAIQEYAVENFAKIGEGADDKFNDGVLGLMQVLKNNVGPLMRREGTQGNYKFFEEMEWRYTPLVYPRHNQVYSDYDELDKDYPTKPHLPEVCLPLTFNDINWIIVERVDQIPDLINRLKAFNHLFGNSSEFEILISRILSMEQIQNDF